MCTVTFIARRRGYALGMNRDEQRTRVAALPPSRQRLDGRNALLPAEPGGGTWIGVNDTGATLALINWYSVAARVSGPASSRGQLVRSVLSAAKAADVDGVLARRRRSPRSARFVPSLARVNPFRLIGIFPSSQAVVEWRWNLHRLERVEHPWETRTWISSGFDEPGAQTTRGHAFQDALRQQAAGTLPWLHRLHRSHLPERGPYSHCMHRPDAVTVSYTVITVSRQQATLRYTPGPPCHTPPLLPLRLPLKSAGGTRASTRFQ